MKNERKNDKPEIRLPSLGTDALRQVQGGQALIKEVVIPKLDGAGKEP